MPSIREQQPAAAEGGTAKVAEPDAGAGPASASAPSSPAASAASADTGAGANGSSSGPLPDLPLYSTDAFRISAFKVLLCSNRGSHDW